MHFYYMQQDYFFDLTSLYQHRCFSPNFLADSNTLKFAYIVVYVSVWRWYAHAHTGSVTIRFLKSRTECSVYIVHTLVSSLQGTLCVSLVTVTTVFPSSVTFFDRCVISILSISKWSNRGSRNTPVSFFIMSTHHHQLMQSVCLWPR